MYLDGSRIRSGTVDADSPDGLAISIVGVRQIRLLVEDFEYVRCTGNGYSRRALLGFGDRR